MKQRIRKKRKGIMQIRGSSGNFYHHLLHSDKSTYFYNTLPHIHAFLSSLMPLTCLVALLGLGLILINPHTTTLETAYAAEESNNEEISTQAEIPESGIQLSLDTTLPEDGTIIEPVTDQSTHYITVSFSVGANQVSEYNVYVQADKKALVGQTQGDTIQSINTDALGTGFSNKTWGISVAEGSSLDPKAMTYSPVQTGVSTPAAHKSNTDGSNLTNINQDYTLSFAANMNGAKPDHYKSNIVLSVAMGTDDVTELPTWTIHNMQEMNSTICANAEENTTGQLTDLRDGKQYWVSKLKDGNCWMVQNLDFDIPAELSNKDTDINVDADGSAINNDTSIVITTNTAKIATPYDWKPNYNARYNAYIDVGNYFYNGPSNNPYGQGTPCNTTISLSECIEQNSGEWSTSGDFHYHIGNHYTQFAATIGSSTAFTELGYIAPNSICPKGWQLPSGGANANGTAFLTNGKTFAKLFDAYGWIWKNGGTIGISTTNLNGGTNYYIYKEPFYFTYSGMQSSNNQHGSISVGGSGNFLSSTYQYANNPFNLYFSSMILGAHSGSGQTGISVRCVAR